MGFQAKGPYLKFFKLQGLYCFIQILTFKYNLNV